MRTKSINRMAAAAVALLGVTMAPPLPAITGGPADNDNHPAVGFISGQLTDPSVCRVQLIGCEGVLIGSDVLLTTGFCADLFKNASQYGFDLTAIRVGFDPDSPFDCSTAIRVREIYVHPGFDLMATAPTNDVGVMILETPPPIEPARLPSLNENESLARREPMMVIGFGGIEGGSRETWFRRVGPSELLKLDEVSITTRFTVPRVSTGGFGGQGTFVGETNQIAGITADGYRQPAPFALTQRVDIQSVRDFLANFVTLP